MWQTIKKLTARTLQFLYSASQGSAAIATTSTSSAAKFGLSSYGIIASAGFGLAQFITTASFDGNAAYRNIVGLDDSDDDAQTALQSQSASWAKKAAYYTTTYSYVLFFLTLNWLYLYFLLGNLKAYFTSEENSNDDSHDNVYVALSYLEMILGILYYIAIDMPFELTGPIWETVEKFQENFGVNDSLAAQLKYLFKPILSNRFFQRWVRISGSLSHTVQHILPLAIIGMPVHVLHKLIAPRYHTTVIACSSVIGLALGIPIAGETYYFDGGESVKNMQSITDTEPNNQYELEYLYTQPDANKIKSVANLLTLLNQVHSENPWTLNDVMCNQSIDELAKFILFLDQNTGITRQELIDELDHDSLNALHASIAKAMTVILPKKVLPAFKRSIQAIGPLAHGVDDAMPIAQCGMYFSFSPLIYYGAAGAAFIASALGNYWSEVKVSVKEIDNLQALLLFWKVLDAHIAPSQTTSLINS